MNKKLLIGLGILFLIIPFVNSAPLLNDTFEDNDATDWSLYGTGNTMIINSSNPLSGSFSGWELGGSDSSDYMYKNFTSQNNNFTFNFQFKLMNKGNDRIYIALATEGQYYVNSHFILCSENTNKCQYYNGGGYIDICSFSLGTQYNFSITVHNFGADSKADYRVNGISYVNNTESRGNVPTVDKIMFGLQEPNCRALIDNACGCSGEYNFTCCDSGPAPVGASGHFGITGLTDEDDGSSITTFKAIVNGTTYTTNNGTIQTNILNNASVFVDVNLSSADFFNKSLSYNVSTNLTTTMFQSLINFQGYEILSNQTINGTYYRNGTLVNQLNNHFSAGYYNFTFENSSYYNRTIWFNITPRMNTTINITGIYNTILNISVKNAYSGIKLTNFTGWIYNSNYTSNITFNSGTLNYSSTGLLQGYNYSVFVEHPHYAISPSTNFQNTTTLNTTYHNISLGLYSNNSIRIFIRNEGTGNLITDNITIVTTLNVTQNTYSTTNGTLYLDGLTDGNYSVVFSAGNYTTKSYTVTVADRSTQTLTAYMSQTYQQVIFTVIDGQSGNTIEGASFQMARIINSSWATVESKYSDITGRVQVNYLPNVQYRFTTSQTGYRTRIFYLNPVIFASYTIQLTPLNTEDESRDYAGISVSFYPNIFYNNASNTFTWTINSPEGSLESYNLSLSYPGGTNSFNGVNAIGETFNVTFNITGATFWDRMNITYYYDSTTGGERKFFQSYQILGAVAGNHTFEGLRNETYGLGLFERSLIAILTILIIVGFAYLLSGSAGATVLGLLSFGFFVYLGFLPAWSVLITVFIGVLMIVRFNQV